MELPGYYYYPGLDIAGQDITNYSNKNISELKILSDSDSNSLGFNTLGYIKKNIGFKNLIKIRNKPMGLYIKNTNLSEYIFLPGKDSVGYDIITLYDLNINKLKLICDLDPVCSGFNSYGFIKYKINQTNNLINIPYIPHKNINLKSGESGLYIKKIYYEELIKIPISNIYDKKIKIFIINLARRSDRKNKMEKIFQSNFLTGFEFFPAFDGQEIKPSDNISNLFKNNRFNWRRGVLGCALSHYTLWQNLNSDPYDQYLIFEDDIQLSTKFPENLNLISDQIYDFPDLDLLLLGYFAPDKPKKIKLKNKNFKITKFDNPPNYGGAFAYILKKSGAKKLLNYISHNNIKYPIDIILLKSNILNIYQVTPHIAFSQPVSGTNQADSDIQRDFTPIFK